MSSSSFLAAWNLRKNFSSLVTKPTSSSHVGPLDGFRVVAVAWVVLLHYFGGIFFAGLNEEQMEVYDAMSRSIGMRGVLNGGFGVDIFFVLSGFLIMTILRKDMARCFLAEEPVEDLERPLITNEGDQTEKQKQKQDASLPGVLLSFFVRRWFRLMPAYLLLLIINGVAYCGATVWRNLLFIQNFWPNSEMCMVWSWSIAVEWQMYCLSPFIVYATLRWPRFAVGTVSAVALVSIALYMGLSVWVVCLAPSGTSYDDVVYIKFYTRMFPYAFGMIIALLFADRAHSPPKGGLGWTLRLLAAALTILTAVFTSTSPNVQSFQWYAAQVVLARPLFSLGLSYCIYDCLEASRNVGETRYLDVYNGIFSSTPMYFVAQVSYGIYLVHPLFISMLYSTLTEPLAAGTLEFIPQWIFPVFSLAGLVISTLVASIIFLLLEKPFINLAATWSKRI